MLTLRWYTHQSPKSPYFPKLELDSMSSPVPTMPMLIHINGKNQTHRCTINLRGVCTTSNIEIPGGRGYASSKHEI